MVSESVPSIKFDESTSSWRSVRLEASGLRQFALNGPVGGWVGGEVMELTLQQPEYAEKHQYLKKKEQIDRNN